MKNKIYHLLAAACGCLTIMGMLTIPAEAKAVTPPDDSLVRCVSTPKPIENPWD